MSIPIVLVAYDTRKHSRDDLNQFLNHMARHEFSNSIYICNVNDDLPGACFNVAFQVWAKETDTLILQDLDSCPGAELLTLYSTPVAEDKILKLEGQTRILPALYFKQRNGMPFRAQASWLDAMEDAPIGLAEMIWDPRIVEQLGANVYYCEVSVDEALYVEAMLNNERLGLHT